MAQCEVKVTFDTTGEAEAFAADGRTQEYIDAQTSSDVSNRLRSTAARLQGAKAEKLIAALESTDPVLKAKVESVLADVQAAEAAVING